MATSRLLQNLNGERLEPHHFTIIKCLWNDPGIKVNHTRERERDIKLFITLVPKVL